VERFVGIDVALREHRIASSTVMVKRSAELHHRREQKTEWPRLLRTLAARGADGGGRP